MALSVPAVQYQPDDHLYQDPHELNTAEVALWRLGDGSNRSESLRYNQMIYRLGAQSHVAVSFEHLNTQPMDALGAIQAIRICGLTEKTRFYQASTSELYGLVKEIPQRETIFHHVVLWSSEALRVLDHSELQEAYGNGIQRTSL